MNDRKDDYTMANLIYKGLKANLPAERNANSFYLCTDVRELYFGTDLYTEAVRFYDGTKPTAPAQGVLYVDTVSGAGDVWNGSAWKSVFTAIVTKTVATSISASASDSEVPTAKAVKDYVSGITGSELGELAHKDEVSEAELEATLKQKINGKVDSVEAADKSVVVGGEATKPTVKVNISSVAKNALELDNTEGQEGLKVILPDADAYTIVKDESAADGFAATYHLTKNGENVGAAINIPKDMVVQSGSVVTDPVGQAKGTYLKLVLANAESSEIYIPVDSLIEYVTSGSSAGDMVVISIDEITHKVTATITDGTITKDKLTTELQTEINKAHTHANKVELDKIAEGDKAKWDAAEAKAHDHANKAELDKIAVGDKAKWDAAEQNAKDYADGLNTAMDGRVTAAENKLATLNGDEKTEGSVKKALADAKSYSDGLNTDMDTRVKAVEEAITVGTF